MSALRLVATAGVAAAFAALAGAVSCTSFDDAPSPPDEAGAPPADGGPGANADGASTTDDGGDGGDAKATGTFCERIGGHVLCDDFEDEILAAPHWAAFELTNVDASAMSIVGQSAGADDAYFRVVVPPANGTNIEAALRHDIGPPTASIKFGLNLRLSGFGANDSVEIAAVYAPSVAFIGLVLEAGKLQLSVGGVGSDLLEVADPSKRTRYVVTVTPTSAAVTVAGTKAGEVKYDAGAVLTNEVRFGVGLVYANQTSGGIIEIDDVTLDY